VLQAGVDHSPLRAQAPDPHAAQPERPTVATHAGTVAPGWIELEAGMEHDHIVEGENDLLFPVVLKIGLAPRWQVELAGGANAPPGGRTGLGDLSAAFKWRLSDHLGPLGRFAVQAALKLPTGSESKGRGTGTTDGSLLLISSHSFGPVSLDVNVGYTRRSGDGSTAPKEAWLWTFATGFPLSGPVGGTVEVYGLPATEGPAGSDGIVAGLGGLTWSIHPWLVLDAGAIVALSGPQAFGLFTGLTWNIGRL
jgi:hypothetical protein